MLSKRVSELDLDDSEGQLTQIICLSNVSWQTYQRMLNDIGEHRTARVAYDQGVLTIKMPSELHEFLNRLLAYIVRTLAVELGLLCTDVGSMTLHRDDLEKGAEPDTGFYIQNAISAKGTSSRVPENLPPDLLVEVDITSPSTRRMSIYRALGIAEVWQYTKRNSVIIHHLERDGYVEGTTSLAFSRITNAQLNQFMSDYQNDIQLTRDIRSWAGSFN